MKSVATGTNDNSCKDVERQEGEEAKIQELLDGATKWRCFVPSLAQGYSDGMMLIFHLKSLLNPKHDH